MLAFAELELNKCERNIKNLKLKEKLTLCPWVTMTFQVNTGSICLEKKAYH